MKNYKVISLDMFQTLVNVQDRTGHVWRRILLENYSDERALELGGLLLSHYHTQAEAIRAAGRFCTTREIYRRGFGQVFRQHAMNFDDLTAVTILFEEHRQSPLYEETERFLRRITGGEYQVCIVSDTDMLMLPDFYKDYPIRLFSSEEYQSYKNDGLNRMFSEVIAFYGVKPGEIIHIGDSASDVLGAGRAGMKTCWLNREGVEWKHEVKPDYTVSDLDEFYAIL
ncbi:HAD family hydrolase [Paenibacillus sp. HW567]|uniref:HAD family hydrolase n=1 Tax=Paenibacillus sp. HW567 TaxID=1034769 RepID=UPI0003656AB7|nr:HAD family hydrolase [Paenibacillus sp. HW567]